MEGGAAESQEKSSPTSHTEGESLAYVGRTTEDLYSVYLHGISQRNVPPPQPHQQQRLDHAAATYNVAASYSNTMLLHEVTNNAVNYQNFARSGYILPEPFYSLGFQQQYPSPRNRALIGNLRGNPLSPRVMRFEGIPNANNVSAGGGSNTYVVGESSAQGAARKKRRMISQGNINFQGENFIACDTSGERYTIYDNKYEEIGLPMDPHIRAFLANNANGNHVRGSASNT
ncbi:uncharacterized protein [Henckelia pumila]|uniref:uncharacterized protein n=1 Tax=Henckelia pumila TaxID=405737 RepID=UPI003C6E405B